MFPEALDFESLDTCFRVSKQGPRFTAVEEDGGDKRLVELELACQAEVLHCQILFSLAIAVITKAILRQSLRQSSCLQEKSPGMDNTLSELLINGSQATTITTCQKIWETKKWLQEWTQSLIIPLPRKGSIKQCQNYHI